MSTSHPTDFVHGGAVFDVNSPCVRSLAVGTPWPWGAVMGDPWSKPQHCFSEAAGEAGPSLQHRVGAAWGLVCLEGAQRARRCLLPHPRSAHLQDLPQPGVLSGKPSVTSAGTGEDGSLSVLPSRPLPHASLTRFNHIIIPLNLGLIKKQLPFERNQVF